MSIISNSIAHAISTKRQWHDLKSSLSIAAANVVATSGNTMAAPCKNGVRIGSEA